MLDPTRYPKESLMNHLHRHIQDRQVQRRDSVTQENRTTTIDGRNPAPPEMVSTYENPIKNGIIVILGGATISSHQQYQQVFSPKPSWRSFLQLPSPKIC